MQEAPLDKGSVVVYVWRQVTAEAVCALLQGDGHDAVAYHGGMEAGARQRAQNAFMRGRSRVVVATVAFGLGVDMRDIRGVVHFDMPKSIENYVQVMMCCLLPMFVVVSLGAPIALGGRFYSSAQATHSNIVDPKFHKDMYEQPRRPAR